MFESEDDERPRPPLIVACCGTEAQTKFVYSFGSDKGEVTSSFPKMLTDAKTAGGADVRLYGHSLSTSAERGAVTRRQTTPLRRTTAKAGCAVRWPWPLVRWLLSACLW